MEVFPRWWDGLRLVSGWLSSALFRIPLFWFGRLERKKGESLVTVSASPQLPPGRFVVFVVF